MSKIFIRNEEKIVVGEKDLIENKKYQEIGKDYIERLFKLSESIAVINFRLKGKLKRKERELLNRQLVEYIKIKQFIIEKLKVIEESQKYDLFKITNLNAPEPKKLQLMPVKTKKTGILINLSDYKR